MGVLLELVPVVVSMYTEGCEYSSIDNKSSIIIVTFSWLLCCISLIDMWMLSITDCHCADNWFFGGDDDDVELTNCSVLLLLIIGIINGIKWNNWLNFAEVICYTKHKHQLDNHNTIK